MEIFDKDIFTCAEDIIVHQTNCQGVMGSGIAKQVKEKYPEVFNAYYHYCKTHIVPDLLGTSLICEANDGKIIANVFGQNGFGGGLQTDYDALRNALQEVYDFAKENKKSVAIPYKLGCGLAGGDWNKVFDMITEVFSDIDNCNIYRLEMNESY